MSTNGIIARSTGESRFEGRYHHWDSQPNSLGVTLVELYRGHFRRDLDKMLAFLLDQHTGWSSIVRKDFKLKPGFTNVAERPKGMTYDDFANLPLNRRPQCYCHGHRKEEGFVADQTTDCGAQWSYVFETTDDKKVMHVLGREKNDEGSDYHWQEFGRIELDSDEEINWTAIECGEKFERCGHYAWHHNLAPRDCNLSTQAFLGNRALDLHDVVAVIVDGRTYKLGSSAGDSDFLNQMNRQHHPEIKTKFPPSTWVASCISRNGRTIDLPIAYKTTDGKFLPYDGVSWVYPATKVSPERVVGA